MIDLSRLGENHWRATITDHEISLIRQLLAERSKVIDACNRAGIPAAVLNVVLRKKGLSFRCIAIRFEVGKSTIRDIAIERRRVYSGVDAE